MFALQAIDSVVSAMVLTTVYAAGLRVSEACRLKVKDIDSKRGLIHVRLGKGGKDMYVMLGATLLTLLRQYWVQTKPTGWLFPGYKGQPLSPDAVRKGLDSDVTFAFAAQFAVAKKWLKSHPNAAVCTGSIGRPAEHGCTVAG